MFDDDDALKDEGIESGTGASSVIFLIPASRARATARGSEGVAEGEASPASGTTEGDDAVGIV